MMCPCGGMCRQSRHEVKTIKKASEWTDNKVSPDALPIVVHQEVCKGCGRGAFVCADRNNNEIYRKGM